MASSCEHYRIRTFVGLIVARRVSLSAAGELAAVESIAVRASWCSGRLVLRERLCASVAFAWHRSLGYPR